jgi:ketosteroid isomerase-like protein
MKSYFLSALLLIGFAISLSAQNKQEKELIIKQIQDGDRKFESFMKKGMTDSIANMFSSKCKVATEFGAMIEDREAVGSYFINEKKAGRKYSDYSLKSIDQKVYGDVVVEMGTNVIKYSMGADKRLYTSEYNYMLVWKKSKNGPYQIKAAMWNLVKNPCAQ